MSSPPHQTQSPFKFALRYCGSCVVTLVYWSIWLVLGTTLVTLAYVALARELPVPDFVLRRVEARLAEANFSIKFGRALFDPSGEILLEDVQVRSTRFEEPLLTSRLVLVRRSLWSILAGRPVPDEIRLEGATLQLPAMLSPSGTAEPLVRDLALVLRHDETLWHVDQLAGRVGQLAVTAEGAVSPPSRVAGTPPLSLEEFTTRFLQIGRRLVLAIHQFDAFEDPTVDVHLESPAGVGNTAAFVFTARAVSQPWSQPLTLGPVAAAATLRLDGKGERTVRLHAVVQDAAYRDRGVADNVRAILSARVDPAIFSVRPVTVLLAVGAVTADHETALGPVLRANLADWPVVHATVAAQIRGEFLAAEVDAQLQAQSARIRASGRVAPELITGVLTRHTPRAAPYFVFVDPVAFTAEAVLAPGWRFDRVASRVASGRLDSHGVKIDAARGRIDIVGTSFLAYDAQVVLGGSGARGSYWMDFATTDYRMLLTGRLRPPEIGGWFRGVWWPDFWNEHFSFPGVPPEGDVDVQGRWRDVAYSQYFGRGDAPAAVVHGVAVERAHTLIFLRPHYTHGLEVDATRAGGSQRAGGWFKRFAEADSQDLRTLEFGGDANLDLDSYRRLFEGKADGVLADWQFTRPPQLHAEGRLEGKLPAPKPNLTFTGQADGGLHYLGVPLDSMRAAGSLVGGELRLDDIQFAIAGGKGSGRASLAGPPEARRLGFDINLNGADLVRSIRAVEEFHAARTGEKSASVAESKFIKRASGGRLEVALSAQGRPGDIASFTGTGNAALKGSELAEIHLFGLLSQALSALSLNFGSLKLDEARSSFKMEGGRLRFPDLKISGPSAAIDARGDFTFATNQLDFTAKFKPYEQSHTLLEAAVKVLANPIASILELKLTGPLTNPEWTVTVGSSAPRPEPVARPEPLPPADKPAGPPAPAR